MTSNLLKLENKKTIKKVNAKKRNSVVKEEANKSPEPSHSPESVLDHRVTKPNDEFIDADMFKYEYDTFEMNPATQRSRLYFV